MRKVRNCGLPTTQPGAVLRLRREIVGMLGLLFLITSVRADILWQHAYDYQYYDNSSELIATADGGYAWLSYIMADDFSMTSRAQLIKLDSNGDREWSMAYDSTGELLNSVVQTSDGGFLLGGKAVSSVVDFVLIKTDGDGAVEWLRTYDMGAEDEIFDIAAAPDGGFVATGTTERSTTDENLVLLKVDANGDSLWANEYYADIRSEGTALTVVGADGYLLGGFLQSEYRDAWLLRVDSNGEEVWSKTYNPGNALCEINDVAPTADGGFVAAGLFAEGGIWGSGDRFWVLRTDQYGDTVWTASYDGYADESALRIIENESGGFGVLGETESYGAGKEDMWFIRLNAEGDSLWSVLLGTEYRDPASGLAIAGDGGWVLAGSAYNTDGSRDLHVLKIEGIVVETGPVAAFSMSADSGVAPLIVSFTDQSLGDPISWEWDFDGDGMGDAVTADAQYTFDIAGSYEVRLIVSDGETSDTAYSSSPVIVTAPEPEAFAWTHYPREQMWGAPNQNGVKSLAIDPLGTTIFGTAGGVCEFDGLTWLQYDASPNENWPGIAGVAVASNGTRWYVGPGGIRSFNGDNVFDESLWTTHDVQIGDGLDIFVDRDEDVWVGGTEGLGRWDGEAWTVYHKAQTGLAEERVNSIVQDLSGNIWIAGTSGASRYDGSSWTGYTQSDGMDDDHLLCAAVDSTGDVWFGRYYGGIIKYDDGAFVNIESDTDGKFTYQYIKGIAFAPDGALWVRTDQGVFRHNGVSWTDYDVENGLLSLNSNCSDLVFDSFGALWTGSEEGVSRYGPTSILAAGFSVDRAVGTDPLTVHFRDLSSGTPTSYHWDFGDGATSSEQSPSHEYAAEGTYTVQLTVVNGNNVDVVRKENYIIVSGDDDYALRFVKGTNDRAIVPRFSRKLTGSAATLFGSVFFSEEENDLVCFGISGFQNTFAVSMSDGGLTGAAATPDGAVTVNAEMEVNRWVDVALSWDGTVVRLYVDGNLASSGEMSGTFISNDIDLVLGGEGVFGGGCMVDNVGGWNQALSATEIAALSDGSDSFDIRPEHLQGLWSFNKGTGSRAYDASGNEQLGFLTDTSAWTPKGTSAPVESLIVSSWELSTDSLLRDGDTLRILFSQPVVNQSVCSHVSVEQDSSNDRYTSYGCLPEFAWFESDTVLAMAFERYSFLGNDTGSLRVILSGFENASGAVMETDTVALKWNDIITLARGIRLPVTFAVSKVFPNPIRSFAGVNLSLPHSGAVRIDLLDMSGRLVQTLHNAQMPAGYHALKWRTTDIAPGRYLCRVRTNRGTLIRLVAMVR